MVLHLLQLFGSSSVLRPVGIQAGEERRGDVLGFLPPCVWKGKRGGRGLEQDA